MRNLPSLPRDSQVTQRQDAEYIMMPTSSNSRESHFNDYIMIFKRRKWWIIIPFTLIMALVVTLGAFEKPVYRAMVTLLIEDVNPRIVPVQEILPPEHTPNFFNTQYEIIKSRAIVGELVDTLRLDQQLPQEDSPVAQVISTIKRFLIRLLKGVINTFKGLFSESPAPQSTTLVMDPAEQRRQNAITFVQQNMQVRPRPETKLVDVMLQGSDSVAVVEQANLLAEIYIKQNLDAKLRASRKAIAWLQQEATSLREKTQHAELSMEHFKAGKDFLLTDDFGQRQNTSLQRLDRLNASYVERNTARLQLQTQIAELKKVAKQDVEEIIQFPGMEDNPFLRSLKSKYFDLHLEYANRSNRFGSKHPQLIQMKADMDEVVRTISGEIHNLISQLEKEYTTLLAEENMLKAELDAQKGEIFGFSDEIRQYHALQRDLNIDQDLQGAVSKRLAEATLTEALTTNNIRIIERALEGKPVSQTSKTLMLNLVLGLGFAVGLALMAEYLDKRFKTADEVEQYLGLPCLGVIPSHRGVRRLKNPIILQERTANMAETYRSLRTWVQASMPQLAKSLLITSATPAEGKSTTAANLAVSFAQLGRRVLLVDADLRRPTLHRAFGLTNSTGLTDILVHGVHWRRALQETDLENLQLLLAGPTPSNPVELLSTHRMKTFIEHTKHAYDLVIFDAPMVLSLPDVAILAPTTDGVLFVHSPKRRAKNVILQAKQLLERLNAHLIGVVLNNVSEKEVPYYSRYHYDARYRTYAATRPTNAHAAKFIDMQPTEGGENWIPEPAVARTNVDSPPNTVRRTARSGSFALTLLEMRLQQRIAEAESGPGVCFLVLDLELVNDAESPYTFRPALTTIRIAPQNDYNRALASLITIPPGSGMADLSSPGMRVFKYDPLATGKIDQGIVAAAVIAPQSVAMGRLVYRVPPAAEDYVFEYEGDDVNITIAFREPSLT